jgi:hypothetical protein
MMTVRVAGAWMIHVVLIATGKVIIDAIPGVTKNTSWTAVNLGYLAVRPHLYYSTALLLSFPTDLTAPSART